MAYRLLLVDDDKETVAQLKATLLKEGYEIETAFDGDEGLVKVKGYNPDIILLDLMMPKKNGFDVLKEVREKYNDKWRPVIIISGRDELDSVKKCYNLEADYYLTKPVAIKDLLRGIKIMISLIPAHLE